MAAVKSLCNGGIVLQNGRFAFSGSQYEAVDFYQKNSQSVDRLFHDGPVETAPGNDIIRLIRFEVIPRTGDMLTMYSGIDFVLEFYYGHSGTNIDITYEVKTQDDIMVFHSGSVITENYSSKKGIYTTICKLPQQLLNAGVYSVSIIFGENQRQVLFKIFDCISFEVMQESTGSNYSKMPGVVYPKLELISSFKHYG
jgi:lipopolysaccharide transport system ATP-binding protein